MSSAPPEQELLASIESGQAPRRILEFAARGFVPLPPAELVRAVGSILAAKDPELSALCEETFATFDTDTLLAAVRSDGVRAEQVDVVARRTKESRVLEAVIQSRVVPDSTLEWLAGWIPPDLQDVLVTNQARLLASPGIVERLFENPEMSSDIRRRADEFLEEFFLKKEREALDGLEEAVEAEEQAPSADGSGTQATAAPTPAEIAAAADAQAEDDEGKSLFARLATLSVSQRIRIAFRGNREERLFLIRDTNRLVATAVLKSPKTNEADAEAIANMKSVSEDVLRAIAQRRQFLKKYSIVAALVRNPRSPIDVTLPLIPRLGPREQAALASDRNVPEAIRVTARRIVARRQMS